MIDDPRVGQANSRWQEWRTLILFLFALVLIRAIVVDWNYVPSRSMAPAIIPGDRVFVNKLAYGVRLPFAGMPVAMWDSPRYSDVIVFKAPDTEILTIKRVVGLPGDRVSWTENGLTINGVSAAYDDVPLDNWPSHLGINYGHTRLLRERILEEERFIMRYRVIPRRGPGTFETVTVPAHHYLVMGDNRDNSRDFRKFGFVSKNAIVGQAKRILFSLDSENFYLPRLQRSAVLLR